MGFFLVIVALLRPSVGHQIELDGLDGGGCGREPEPVSAFRIRLEMNGVYAPRTGICTKTQVCLDMCFLVVGSSKAIHTTVCFGWWGLTDFGSLLNSACQVDISGYVPRNLRQMNFDKFEAQEHHQHLI